MGFKPNRSLKIRCRCPWSFVPPGFRGRLRAYWVYRKIAPNNSERGATIHESAFFRLIAYDDRADPNTVNGLVPNS